MTPPPLELKDRHAKELRHYSVYELLGSGASSDAFRVTDHRNERTYVLKQMPLFEMSPEDRERAKQEIEVMNGVDHPNVVKFRESFSGSNSVNIVMEYCEFGTLEQLIERQRFEGKPFPTEVVVEWMTELLSGLAHIHAKNIMHRDIKTSNIFVTAKNHLKLGDFGVCSVLSNERLDEPQFASMFGTPYYLAPEVCLHESYDERSDVWSLGVVFYEMCTFRRPFDASNVVGLMTKIVSEPASPLNPEVDIALQEIILNMLNKDPMERPTAQELIDIHLEVPASHPSHPSQKPAVGRVAQQQYGPELLYEKEWNPEAAMALHAPAMMRSSEWIVSGCSDTIFGDAVPPPPPPPPTSPPQPASPLKAAAVAPKSEEKKANTPRAVPSSAAATPRSARRKLTKNVISRAAPKRKSVPQVDTPPPTPSDARPSTGERRVASRPAIDLSKRGGVPHSRTAAHSKNVSGSTPRGSAAAPVVRITSRPLSAGSAASSPATPTPSAKVTESPPPPPTSTFLADLQKLLRTHGKSGKGIDLDALDDAVQLLHTYKLEHYGPY